MLLSDYHRFPECTRTKALIIWYTFTMIDTKRKENIIWQHTANAERTHVVHTKSGHGRNEKTTRRQTAKLIFGPEKSEGLAYVN